MPRRIPDETKRQAIGILQIHDDISLAHHFTGVHRRTLRRWRNELRGQKIRFPSEKVLLSDIKRTQNLNSDTNAQPAAQAAVSSADEIDAANATDLENLTHIRAKLMNYARSVADGLSPDQSDSNSRTMALSRVLDRIQLLDQTLPELLPKERPPWQDAHDALLELDLSPWELMKVEKEANAFDDNLRVRVYEHYHAYHVERLRVQRIYNGS